MIQIIDTRASGKTSRLLLLAQETHGILVCADPRVIKERADLLGLTNIKNIISYHDFIKHNYEYNTPIFIDELELFVKSLGNNFMGYSLSIE